MRTHRKQEPTAALAIREQLIAEHESYAADASFPMKPQRVLIDVRKVMRPGDILLSDVGAHKMWIARHYNCYKQMCIRDRDDAGKITAVSFDIAQNKIGFDAAGALTSELTGEHPTKKELGDAYGMKGATSIGKEWYEQAEALEAWCIGKTVEEVVSMPTYDKGDGHHTQVPDDVDLKSGCTIDVGNFLQALQKAADNACLLYTSRCV